MQSRELHREQQPDDVHIQITPSPRRGLCAEIEHLNFYCEPPAGTGAALGEAIKCSGKLSYLALSNFGTVGKAAPEFSRLLSVSHNAVLEQLDIQCFAIDNECMSSLTQFARLCNLKMCMCDFDVALLAKWIIRPEALESLTISRATLSPSIAQALAAALTKLPMITDLALCCVIRLETRSNT